MKVSEVWPSRYLEAANLGDKEWKLTIEKVIEKHRDTGPDGKPFIRTLLHFKNTEKGLLCGPEKCKIIRDKLGYGEEMQTWIGKSLTIFASTRNAFGDPKLPCIRVKIVSANPGGMR